MSAQLVFRELVNKLGVVHSCRLSHTPFRRCGAGLCKAEESGDDGGKKGWVGAGTEAGLIMWDPWCCPWRGLMLWTA